MKSVSAARKGSCNALSCFLLAVTLISVVAASAPASRFCAARPRYTALPHKFDPSLIPNVTVPLTDKVFLVIGDVSKICDYGQGNSIAKFGDLAGMKLIGASNSSACPDTTWPHFKGDLSDDRTAHAFARWLKRELQRVYDTDHVDYVHITLGKMGWIYGQDESLATETQIMRNNYGAPYNLVDILRSETYQIITNDTKSVGVHVSTGSFLPTGNSFGYEMSKAALEHKWTQLIGESIRNESATFYYAVFPDAVYKTCITCNKTWTPLVDVEQCLPLTSAIRTNAPCPLPIYTPYFTVSDDIGQFVVKVIMPNALPANQRARFYVVNAPGPVDDQGGQIIDWAWEFHLGDPGCFYEAYFQHFGNPLVGRTIAAPCTEPVGPR
jgi:hypothetical protein